jgi:hypothetical protein
MQKDRQGRFTGLTHGFHTQAIQYPGSTFDQRVIVPQPGGIQIADAAELQFNTEGLVDIIDNIPDIAIKVFDHLIGIASNFETDIGVIGDLSVVEPAGDLADDDLRSRFLGQAQSKDRIDHFVDNKNRVRLVVPAPLLFGGDAAARSLPGSCHRNSN